MDERFIHTCTYIAAKKHGWTASDHEMLTFEQSQYLLCLSLHFVGNTVRVALLAIMYTRLAWYFLGLYMHVLWLQSFRIPRHFLQRLVWTIRKVSSMALGAKTSFCF